MIINKTTGLYYLCAGPKAWNLDIGTSEIQAGHVFNFMNKIPIVWPNKLSSQNCNPTNFHIIKSLVRNRDVVIIDRIKSENPSVNIGGHVNRSGENYLIGVTPYDNYPQFLDMSSIYFKKSNQETTTVHTLGPKRFKGAELNKKIIWSEAAGLVVPVFHYIGFNIKGVGLNSANSLKSFLH